MYAISSPNSDPTNSFFDDMGDEHDFSEVEEMEGGRTNR